MKTVLALALAFWLSGCGQEKVSENSSPTPVTTQADVCDFTFPENDLCAKIKWTIGPTDTQDSAFELSFYSKSKGNAATGPFVDPAGVVGSYLRMTCCGSVFTSKVEKVSAGKYAVTKVRLGIGSWENFVQINKGGVIEKAFVPVKIDG